MKTPLQKLLLFLAFICVMPQLFAQQVTFQREYFNTYNAIITDFTPTADSGFIAVGYCDSITFGSQLAMILKCDLSGNVQWTSNLTDSTPLSNTRALALTPLHNGDFLITLVLKRASGEYGCLVRIDANGQVIWSKLLSNGFWIGAIRESSDNHLFFLFTKDNKFMLAKTDSSLQVVWVKSWSVNPQSSTWDYNIELAPDGIFYTIAFTDFNNDYYFIAKSDSVGNTQWSKWGYHFFPNKIMSLPDSGCQMLYYNGILQLSKTGDTVSNILYNCLWGDNIGCKDFIRTSDKGYAVTGLSDLGAGIFGYAISIMKLDSAAHPLWIKKYPNIRSNSYHIFETPDNGLMVAGYNINGNPYPNHGFAIKTDSAGNTFCNDSIMTVLDSVAPFTQFGGPSILISPASDTVTFIHHSLSISAGISDSVFCLNHTGVTTIANESVMLQVYPNPVQDEIKLTVTLKEISTVRIDLYDFLGNRISRLKESGLHTPGEHHFTYDASNLANGIYLVNMILSGQSRTVKFIKAD